MEAAVQPVPLPVSMPTMPRPAPPPLPLPPSAEAGPSTTRLPASTGSGWRCRDAVVPLAARTSQVASVEGGDTSGEEDDEAYERDRQRRILENQSMLLELGLTGSSSFHAFNASQTTSPKRKRYEKRKDKARIVDRDGYILSLPGPGQRQRARAVVIRPDRRTRRAIYDGEYQDCTGWAAGEERRWAVGTSGAHGAGLTADAGQAGETQASEGGGDGDETGGVAASFRWRKWKGLEAELREEMRMRGEVDAQDSQQATESTESTEYASLPLGTCHQCRRRSDKGKMRCRNMEPECRASFCESCCKRYSYFEFDPYARSFICPLCRGICNCANCIRKRDLAHILEPGQGGIRANAVRSLLDATRATDTQPQAGPRAGPRAGPAPTVEAYLEQVAQRDVEAPFDRVRIVDQATDVVGEIPEVWRLWMEERLRELAATTKKAKPKKKKKVSFVPTAAGQDATRTRSDNALLSDDMVANAIMQASDPSAAAVAPPKKRIRKKKSAASADALSVAAANRPPREKQVDSDGDTVDDGLSDPEDSTRDAPISIYGPAPLVSAPEAPTNINEYLARLVHRPPDGMLGSALASDAAVVNGYDIALSVVAGVDGIQRRAAQDGLAPSVLGALHHMHGSPEYGHFPASQPSDPYVPSSSISPSMATYYAHSISATPTDTPPQGMQTLAPSPQGAHNYLASPSFLPGGLSSPQAMVAMQTHLTVPGYPHGQVERYYGSRLPSGHEINAYGHGQAPDLTQRSYAYSTVAPVVSPMSLPTVLNPAPASCSPEPTAHYLSGPISGQPAPQVASYDSTAWAWTRVEGRQGRASPAAAYADPPPASIGGSIFGAVRQVMRPAPPLGYPPPYSHSPPRAAGRLGADSVQLPPWLARDPPPTQQPQLPTLNPSTAQLRSRSYDPANTARPPNGAPRPSHSSSHQQVQPRALHKSRDASVLWPYGGRAHAAHASHVAALADTTSPPPPAPHAADALDLLSFAAAEASAPAPQGPPTADDTAGAGARAGAWAWVDRW